MKIVLSRALAIVSALVVAACAESSSPAQPSGPLSVTLAPSQLSCHPHPNTPCSVYVEAVVTNTGGGSVSYAWSGCGSGASRSTTCTIDRPDQPLAVAVTVTDDRGQTAQATGTATGTNLPPTVTITDQVMWESWYPSSGGGSFEVFSTFNDPDHSGHQGCYGGGRPPVITAAGICERGYSKCSAGNLDVGALKNAASGACVLTYTAADEWGLTSTTTKAFSLPHK